MKKIQFTRGYRGAATKELFYDIGMVGEFDEAAAAAIIAEGAGRPAPMGAKVTGPDPLADMSGGQLQQMANQAARDAARNAQARQWAQWKP